MLIKHEVKPSALLPLRPLAECFISRKARASQCLNHFKEFPETLDENMFAGPL